MKNLHEIFSQWRKFLSNNKNNDKVLTVISQKKINQDYESAVFFIENMVKTDLSGFYCLNLLIENLNDYTRYLEIPSQPDEDFLGFRLKKSFLNKREDELTDKNVMSFIVFTCQCIEVLLSIKPKLNQQQALLSLKDKVKKESLQDGTI